MNFNSLPQLLDYFKDEKTCIKYFEKQRWGNNITCPHCGHDKVYRTTRGYKCASDKCYKKFSVKVGTIFENSNVSLRIFFAAIWICSSNKKGVSSHNLAAQLEISQKTAWYVLHRVRRMLKDEEPTMLRNTVEIDETYVGGKNKNRHKDKKIENSQGRSAKDKTPVVGILERNGKIKTFVVTDTEGETVKALMRATVDKDATIVTDAYTSYNGLNKEYKHVVVKGADGHFVVDNQFHTQNIENFWSILKRGIYGIYHSVSPKHLSKYCDEFGYRYSSRHLSNAERFDVILTHTTGKFSYKELIGKKQ